VAVVVLVLELAVPGRAADTAIWMSVYGTAGSDSATDIAVDGTGVYVTGFSDQPLAGQTDAGGFIQKYGPDGLLLWTRHAGTSTAGSAQAVAIDGGAIYVAGAPGFLERRETSGTLVWTRTMSFPSFVLDVAVDGAGGVYVVGQASGVFLQKYSSAGDLVWTRQFATSGDDRGLGVSAGGGAVFITGFVAGPLPGQTSVGGYDAFVRKYTADGNEVWTRQFGTVGFDTGQGVLLSSGALYVTGSVAGSLAGQPFEGGFDAFLVKLDLDGTALWTRQFGGPKPFGEGIDNGHSLATSDSRVYVVGSGGALKGTITDDFAAFVRSYDTSGDKPCTFQFPARSFGTGVAVDGTGAYAVGRFDVVRSTGLDPEILIAKTPLRVVTADAGPDQAVVEGTTVGLDASRSSDCDGSALQYAWQQISGPPVQLADPTSAQASFTPGDDGTYRFAVTVTSAAGSGSAEVVVTASNASPSVSMTAPVSGLLEPVGTAVAFQGSFTDAGALDTHTAGWSFDALTTVAVQGAVSESRGSGIVSGTYSFAAPGVYPVTFGVWDDDGGVGSTNSVAGLAAFVVIYDPSGGSASGGGTIQSPAGAYMPDASVTGKAIFGFVSEYRKGRTVPTGEMHFQAPLLAFKSLTYEWLVVAGAKAQFKGTGSINGAGTYRFMVAVIDGKVSGDGIDRLRIKISDSVSGSVVYDNEPGADDMADPTTALRTGSIVVHDK
jgi:hypothetical protein